MDLQHVLFEISNVTTHVLGVIGMVLLGVIAVLFLITASTNLWWSLHAWRTPVVHEEISRSQLAAHRREVTFSAIVPFRHERESVVRATVYCLLEQDHEGVQIVLSVGHDDPEARRIAATLMAEHPDRIVMSVDRHSPKNKPKQLNTALRKCHGEYVAIFDAESLTHPELCSHAASILTETGSEVLQGGVQLVNHRTTWFSLRNCLEYFFWFRSRLHLHAEHGFIPLGGNTVFVRRELLLSVGGWDQDMLTEDCDLGVRLSSHGISVAVSYDPRLVTREETPDTVRALVKQRSRWNQGFLQVLAKGDWRALPHRRQRLLAEYTLLQPYLQATTFAVLPIMLGAAFVLHLPLALTMLLFCPLVPIAGTLMFEVAALREFGAVLDLPIGVRDYALLAVSLVPYQIVLGFAAMRAMLRHWHGDDAWEKTAHAGNHLAPAALTEAAAA
jgi:cellulose synthase/poly-beta-1,6-N-acetylglucosamine synthase-like glycosyltransferase